MKRQVFWAWLIVILSSTFMFFQTAKLIKIDYLLIFMMACCVLFLLMRRKLRITQIIILYLSILFLMMLSMIYTVSSDLTTKFLLVMVYGGALYIAVGEMNDAKRIVTKVLLIFAMFNVYVTIFSVVFPDLYATIMKTVLPGVNTDFAFASGILGQTGTNSYVITYAVAYWLVILSYEEKPGLKTMAFLGISLFALFLTGKRGPLLWLAVTFLIVDFTKRRAMNQKNIIKHMAKYVWIILVITVFIVAVDKNELVQQFFVRFTVDEDSDISTGRFELYQRAWSIIKENFVLGIGAGAYNYYGTGAHNDYLQIMADNGLLCSALFFIFIGWNIQNAHSVYMYRKDQVSLYILALQVFMALNALTGTSYLYFGFYFVFMEISAVSYNERITIATTKRTPLTSNDNINNLRR